MEPLNVYAVYHLNEDVRMKSSSGGVFTSLAEYMLASHGIVYGVAMSENCYFAEFIRVTDEKGLDRLRGSKYFTQHRCGWN